MARALTVVLAVALVPLPHLVPASALADEGPEPAAGARIRVTAPEASRRYFGEPERRHLFEGKERRFVGRLFSADEAALRIEISGHEEPAVVPRSAVQRLEISRARSKGSKGALIGLLVGSAAMTFLFAGLVDQYGADCVSASRRLPAEGLGSGSGGPSVLAPPRRGSPPTPVFAPSIMGPPPPVAHSGS
jgi:hypothetical protein